MTEYIPVKNNSLDFAYSLGVLHHVSNTKNAILERLAIIGSIPSLIHMNRSFHVDFESLKFKSKLATHPMN